MDVDAFVTAAVGVVNRHCPLAAAYLVGSLATGDAAGAASDVDLLLITDRRHDEATRLHAGAQLARIAAVAPLRGVEAVLYLAEVVARPRHPLAYELNVNAGPGMSERVATEGDDPFWFLLDVAAARDTARAVLGPPAERVIGRVPDADVVAALTESLAWHRDQGRPDADAVLSTCRALHWLRTRTWVSKTAAGSALLARREDPVVRAALDARRAGEDRVLGAEGVARLHGDLAAALGRWPVDEDGDQGDGTGRS